MKSESPSPFIILHIINCDDLKVNNFENVWLIYFFLIILISSSLVFYYIIIIIIIIFDVMICTLLI